MPPTKVFWLEQSDQERVWLRRYHHTRYTPDGEKVPGAECPVHGYHTVRNLIVDAQPKGLGNGDDDSVPHDDPRWPALCDCGYRFSDDPEVDAWQVFAHRLYSGAPDGQLYTLMDAPVGAMWDASWYRSDDGRDLVHEPNTGPDGITLVVKTPGGDWLVDSEASNCTRTQWAPTGRGKSWTGRTHYCWIRHGDPRKPETLHVDKAGDTCAAGAGSIQAGNYHGFLHHGELIPA